ncbi:hypothetical protein FHS51_003263 [Sphingobium wenxiniae]|uniref:Uncharacterized protein n=2 Tax=Sphingobium TaxID=165695 RepID=T0GL87_9SPHN|nr:MULTISPECIES: hypothetical protein [Sphingobium]EQB01467.1 hypothetical protein L485_10335 [Sphingobium baderi LL03]KMS60541.1 hypothetical protein V475_19570 [Sphingobium baderi LL03]MBB6193008.1 hypothetical protein [Sphingobium wenxiniae]TWH90425.1 hypothetical protein IQ35_03484 [Sphingobium wenxiniae]WRD76339.1 hypothetical protein QQ987_16550 [Sphingobium baderi]
MIDHPFTFPIEAKAVTPELLTEVMSGRYPNAVIDRFDVANAMRYGDGMVSTTGRIAGRLNLSLLLLRKLAPYLLKLKRRSLR